ncbi:MAG TPA: sulfur carrier protein ThiS [Dictyobacter sp.]|jgi:thiamine biosynthesis protein ThiS|nr:sulfur carrier protein ThiS [Dictyobacter sp.]
MEKELQQSDMIAITANEKPYSLAVGSTIADLLQGLNIAARYVVVVRNGDIVARTEFDRVCLHNHDALEIVTLVGGG